MYKKTSGKRKFSGESNLFFRSLPQFIDSARWGQWNSGKIDDEVPARVARRDPAREREQSLSWTVVAADRGALWRTRIRGPALEFLANEAVALAGRGFESFAVQDLHEGLPVGNQAGSLQRTRDYRHGLPPGA